MTRKRTHAYRERSTPIFYGASIGDSDLHLNKVVGPKEGKNEPSESGWGTVKRARRGEEKRRERGGRGGGRRSAEVIAN